MLDIIVFVALIVVCFLVSCGCCWWGCVLWRRKAKSSIPVETSKVDVAIPNDRPRSRRCTAIKISCASFVCSVPVAYLLTCLIFYTYVAVLKSSLLYPGADEDSCCSFYPLPEGGRELYFLDANDNNISAWYIEAPAGSYANSSGPTYVLYNHGSGKNMAVEYRQARYAEYAAMGMSLLVYDYPGYGRSTGSPSEGSIMASAEAALQQLRDLSGKADGEIVNLGRSLGGAVAIQLSAVHTFRGTALQSTFSSYAAAAAVGYEIANWAIREAVGDTFNSVSFADKVGGCIYFYLGTDDEYVSSHMADQLLDKFEMNTSCSISLLDEGGVKHDDPLTARQLSAMQEWLTALPPEQ